MTGFSKRLCKLLLTTTGALTSSGLCLYLWDQRNSDSPASLDEWWTGVRNRHVARAAFPPGLKPVQPWNSNWDGRDPNAVPSYGPGRWGRRGGPSAPGGDSADSVYQSVLGKSSDQGGQGFGQAKFSRHLIFIRHGQYVFAREDEDCHLTDMGRNQAEMTGQRLRQLNLPYTRLVYSTMTRAVESAEEILKHLPKISAQPCDLIQEGAPYPPEPPLPTYRPTLPEIQEDNARIESGFRKHVHRASSDQAQDSYEIYVCHANVIRYFLCRALQFPPEAWLRFSLDHGSITWIVVRPNGRVAVRYVGSSGHFPPDKVTVQ